MSKPEMPKAYEPASIEEKWYTSWESNRLFHGEPKPGKKPYSIVIPPPNVTGILTMGHVLNNTLQDIAMNSDVIADEANDVLKSIRTLRSTVDGK